MEAKDLLKNIKQQAAATVNPAKPKGNPFPIEVFPASIADIARELYNGLSYPTDYTGAAFLYAASVAIGNKFSVRVKGNEWSELSNVWIAITGRPGSNKTHPVTFAIKPLVDRDKAKYAAFKDEEKEYVRISNMTPDQRKAAGIEDVPERPKRIKYLVSDITPEALATVIEDNPVGIGVHRDELSGWVKDFGRYNKGGDQERWISIWSRQAINIDRRSGASLYISNPYVSVIGTIQPKVLADLGQDGRSDNGFVDRILFAMPDKTEATAWTDYEIPADTASQWNYIISRLLDIAPSYDSFGHIEPIELRYSAEAREMFKGWHTETTTLENSTDDDLLKGIYSKQKVYIHRLALILQLLHYVAGNGAGNEIGEAAINGAIQLSGYFMATAQKVAAYVSNTDPLLTLPENKRKIYTLLPEVFNYSEVLDIANGSAELKMSKPTITKWLTDAVLFAKLGHGKYRKLAA